MSTHDKRPKHKARQTARLIHATLELITLHGLNDLSIAKVAQRAGVTRQTVYNYFPDVESIVAGALDAHGSEMERYLVDVIERAPTPLDKVTAFAIFQVKHATPEHAQLNLTDGLSPRIRASLSRHTDNVKAALRDAIVSGTQTGDFAVELDPDVSADFLWGIVQSAVSSTIKYPEKRAELQQMVVRVIHTSLIATPDGRRGGQGVIG